MKRIMYFIVLIAQTQLAISGRNLKCKKYQLTHDMMHKKIYRGLIEEYVAFNLILLAGRGNTVLICELMPN